MFLADRYIKGECPNCHAPGSVRRCLRGVQHRQCADGPHQSLLDAHGRRAGAAAPPIISSSGCPIPQCVEFLRGWLDAPGRLQPQVANKAKEWLDGGGEQGAWRLGHLARCALLRHPDSGCARQVLLRVARCADRLSRVAQELFDSGKARARGEPRSFREFLAAPTPSRSTSSARTSSTSTRCSGRRC